MYLQELVPDALTVLEHAMQHPAMHPKRKPTFDTALKAVVSTLEHFAAKGVSDTYGPIVRDAYDMYELNNGEYENVGAEERSDWESGLDDAVEQAIEPLTPTLSADWLGRNTIDTRLWEPDAIDKFIASLSKEVFKQLAYGKEPGQVLSNAGIVRDDVQSAFDAHMASNAQPKQETNMDDAMQNVIARIHAQVGTGFDQSEVYADLEGITDDDEILSGSSAQRLGLSEDDLQAVQMFALEHGTDTPDKLFEMLTAYKPDEKGKRAGKAAPPPPPATPATASPGAPVAPPLPTPPGPPKAAMPEGFSGVYVLTRMKEHSGIKETDMAAQLGVSRSTFVNWTTGKTALTPDAGQLATIRNRIVNDLNGLYEALCNVDGVDVDRTFD